MTVLEQAKAIRKAMDSLAVNATDAIASTATVVYPKLKEDGSLVATGTRINWNGTLKRAAVDLWDTKENNPDNAPTLWEDILYRDGIRIIPNPITVGLKFKQDELGWWGEDLYRSKVNDNVYTPEQYAANWELVER